MQDDPLLEKGLPANVNAEKSILGAILLNNELIGQAEMILEREDFFLNSHQRIFDAMVSLKETGNPIDGVTLFALLNERRELDEVGGITYMATLIDGVPQTDDIEYYCRIVKYKSRERQAIILFNDGVNRLVDGEEELEAILDRVERRLAQISERANAQTVNGFYPSLDTLFSADFQEREEIICAVHRGDVVGLLAVTNRGKSTLMLNVSLALAAGETCLPLVPVASEPGRVLYLDCESPPASLRADIQKMLHSIDHTALARENLKIAVDAMIEGQPLCLSKSSHFKRVMALAKAYRADLLIVDTAASAFELQDENSNAEVTRRVMNPLKRLARECDCAVVFTHHIGKSNETQSGEAAYKGRGASAFGALSRTILNLETDATKGPGYVVLSCPKAKGPSIEPTLLRLNSDTRWFETCAEKPKPQLAPVTAKEIAEYVAEQGEAHTEAIKSYYAKRVGGRTVADRIADAERLGLIMKPNRKAPWRSCNGEGGNAEPCEQSAENATLDGFVQCAIPIGDARMHESRSNGERGGRAIETVCCSTCNTEGIRFTSCEKCGEFLR